MPVVGSDLTGLSVTTRSESRDAALAALRDYRQHKADFADALIGAANRKAGYKTTFTFDRKAGDLETFTLL